MLNIVDIMVNVLLEIRQLYLIILAMKVENILLMHMI